MQYNYFSLLALMPIHNYFYGFTANNMKNNYTVFYILIIAAAMAICGCKKEHHTGLYIGQKYLQGYIAYILQPGDAGYSDSVPHGLIAAPYDQSAGIQWWNGRYTKTGATGTAIGTGKTNTNHIIRSQQGGNYAANICNEVTLGDSSGWFLPSLDELNQLYLNQAQIGGFSNDYYWSSTEDSVNLAWLIYFNNGYQDNGYKDWTGGRVRAVRTF
jgi:hypothetical protein